MQINSQDVLINNTQFTLDQSAEMMDGTTFVPLRFVSETLGANANYNHETKTITITTNMNGKTDDETK
ncbi:copper amine oxidase N-terminal domain-containing protein [Chengkuizengella axinellae]|uniref:Copper amine oxidase N-terminal domain-containing protein n=1 Tax=Chengkuizengella axinellae TaxID=3064388 RepID=A0ABT9IWZ8_9BACL|nr:copper amine oxidase N-terminal domain-containing protein [Chengkuizengella sp. 2205SS18-9]MDP5273632.1 copper amine oxidase N-terminal domain-containing protein [Chengkuizengella sp. 2205SS18-9]